MYSGAVVHIEGRFYTDMSLRPAWLSAFVFITMKIRHRRYLH